MAGSYTVLRWRSFDYSVLLQRLLLTSLSTLVVLSIARWLVNPSHSVWLVYRQVQLLWIVLLTFWAFLVRVCLRRGFLAPDSPRMLLLAQPQELSKVLIAWRRVPQRQQLHPINVSELAHLLDHSDESILVARTKSVSHDPSFRPLLALLETCDPRQVRVLSVLSLFELQQERLPPVLIADAAPAYDDLPWVAPFSVQAQLKRMADLVVAALLLLSTAPSCCLLLSIWFEDRGPVLRSTAQWLVR